QSGSQLITGWSRGDKVGEIGPDPFGIRGQSFQLQEVLGGVSTLDVSSKAHEESEAWVIGQRLERPHLAAEFIKCGFMLQSIPDYGLPGFPVLSGVGRNQPLAFQKSQQLPVAAGPKILIDVPSNTLLLTHPAPVPLLPAPSRPTTDPRVRPRGLRLPLSGWQLHIPTRPGGYHV